jgi:shikimate dehydrogenase
MTSPRPYAEVIGDPIAHSKSPLIHGFWLKTLGLEAEYRRARVGSSEFDAYLQACRADPFWCGCNVTLPLKERAAAAADIIAEEAREAGAANLLYRSSDGQLAAANTDVAAIAAVLDPQTSRSAGNRVCVIGAGGAACAALAYLAGRDTQEVSIVARDTRKAQELLVRFSLSGDVCSFDLAEQAMSGAEWIVNATPLGMIGCSPMPYAVIEAVGRTAPSAVVFDMVYAPLETDLTRRVGELHRTAINGLSMLIHQAAASFTFLFGQKPPLDEASNARLRELLAG